MFSLYSRYKKANFVRKADFVEWTDIVEGGLGLAAGMIPVVGPFITSVMVGDVGFRLVLKAYTNFTKEKSPSAYTEVFKAFSTMVENVGVPEKPDDIVAYGKKLQSEMDSICESIIESVKQSESSKDVAPVAKAVKEVDPKLKALEGGLRDLLKKYQVDTKQTYKKGSKEAYLRNYFGLIQSLRMMMKTNLQTKDSKSEDKK